MYENEEELNNPLSRILHVTIINSIMSKIDISQKILERTSYEYKDRLKFKTITNIKDLYKSISNSSDDTKKGLIDINWLKDIYEKPSIIILYYHIEPNLLNLELEQQKIYNILQDIKKNDPNIFIFLFIIYKDNSENPYQFSSEDKSKKYNLRNILGKEFIFVFPDEEIWKYFEFSNFCSNIIYYCKQYYMKYKMRIKEKEVKSTRPEEKIELNIELGVISTLKSKKIEPERSIYFDTAYNIILNKNFDIKNYFYGNKNPTNSKLNFCEIRAVADWIFFKTFRLTKKLKISERKWSKSSSVMTKISGSETEHKIDRLFRHIKRFIDNQFYDVQKEDCFAFMEYYWLFNRYDKLGLFIKENLKELSTNKDKVLFLGVVYLEKIYNLIKMIKYYRKYLINQDLSIIKHNEKEIQIAMIKTKRSNLYGKPPIFIIRDAKNPLFKEELPFNEDIYLKKFISDKKLTLDNMVNDLNNKYIPETFEFFQKFNPNDLRNEKNLIFNKAYGVNLYLHILINLSCLENDKEDNNFFNMPNINKNMEQINSIIHNFNYMKKFPNLYINFLDKYNQCLIYQKNTGKSFDNLQKTQLYTNLFLLGYLRKLNETEEEILFELLNDEQFIPCNKNEEDKIYINIDYDSTKSKRINNKENNNSLNFDYSLEEIGKSQERKILDLIEYKFTFNANIKSENQNLKLNSFKIIFKSEIGNKKKIELIEREYSKEELDEFILSKNSNVEIICKLFMKNKMNKIQVNRIIFSFCKKENIFYQINIKNDISKIIFLNKSNKNILNVKYPYNKYKVGINQLFKFDFEINKEISDDISISDFKVNFESIPSYYTQEIKQNEQINLFPNNNLLFNQNTPVNINMNNINNLAVINQQLINQQLINNMNMQLLLQNNMNNINNNRLNNNSIPIIQNQPNLNNNNLNNINKPEINTNFALPLLFTNPLSIKPSMSMPNLQNNIPQLTTPNAFPNINPITPLIVPPKVENINKQIELPFPEYYIYDEENKKMIKSEKNIEKEYKNIEEYLEQKNNKFSALLKFKQKGNYFIKFSISYSLKRKDILDIYEVSQENTLQFEAIEPFNCSYEINSSNFFSISKENAEKENIKINKYLINEKINFNFILKNILKEDINIKNIQIILDKEKLKGQNENLKINSNLLEVMNLPEINEDIKKDILTLLSTGEYCIPFETEFFEEFKGKIGKIKIEWTTPSLNEYESNIKNDNNDINLINENCFDFPYIIINKLELDYKYEIDVNEKKEILLNIKVENHTKKCKKIIFFIESGDEINCMISGKVKQNKNLRAGESTKFVYKLIPLQYGEMKLPSLKIWEMNFNANTKDKKICSHYYFPQKIKVI